jgi:hypothetical protein
MQGWIWWCSYTHIRLYSQIYLIILLEIFVMKMYRLTLLPILLFCIILAGCHGPSSAQAPQESDTNSELLPDSLFYFIGLGDMRKAETYKDLPPKHPMDSFYIDKILMPALMKDKALEKYEGDLTPPRDAVRGDFVVKEKRIGSFTPVVVSAMGDDYFGLFYVLLDSSLSVVSSYRVSGGLYAGPDETTDSLIIQPPARHSVIDGSVIHTYELTDYQWLDSLHTSNETDSISYIAQVTPDGNITITRTDSVRLLRPRAR